MIRTWAADVSSLLDVDKYLQYYENTPDFRREKADKIAHQAGKALSIGAWVLLEKMRKAYGVGEDAVYNLSHSGRYALCSLDDSGSTSVKIGCDVEGVKQVRMKVAQRFFCESEFQYITGWKTDEEKAEAFYRYWVLKESFLKATRQGMKLGMNQFEIVLQSGKNPYLIRQPEEFPQTYYFKEYEIAQPFYKASVCSDNRNISEKMEKIIL